MLAKYVLALQHNVFVLVFGVAHHKVFHHKVKNVLDVVHKLVLEQIFYALVPFVVFLYG
jgi:hypothetical protein